MTDIGSVRREMKKAYKSAKKSGGWREVGRRFGVTGGMAFRIVEQNYEPKEPKIRVVLGLPAMVQAPACPICGEVHLKRHPHVVKRSIASWFDLPMSEIRKAFRERKEMK